MKTSIFNKINPHYFKEFGKHYSQIMGSLQFESHTCILNYMSGKHVINANISLKFYLYIQIYVILNFNVV